MYYGTGNPGLWSPQYRCAEPITQENCNSGKYDNKWSMSIFARNVDTGEAEWVYQMTPFDQWDYDGINEVVLVDMNVDGKMRKCLVHFDRNGFAYVLDRTDGTLLRANKYVTTNWAEKVDMKTGRPVKVYEHAPLKVGGNTQACPSAMGGKDQQPVAVDPNDPENFYVPTNNWCMEDEPQARSHTQQGTVYVFANVYMYPRSRASRASSRNSTWSPADRWKFPISPRTGVGARTGGGWRSTAAWRRFTDGDGRATGEVLWSRDSARNHRRPRSRIRSRAGGTCRSGPHRRLDRSAGHRGLDLSDKFSTIGATASCSCSTTSPRAERCSRSGWGRAGRSDAVGDSDLWRKLNAELLE